MAPSTPASKRVKISGDDSPGTDPAVIRLRRSAFLASLSRPISPPPGSGRHEGNVSPMEETDARDGRSTLSSTASPSDLTQLPPAIQRTSLDWSIGRESALPVPSVSPTTIPSPFRLTHIRDLPPDLNVDAIRIKDILGHPLIREAWIFNFCHDIEWTMQQFDDDVRDLVQVKIVHGFWKREDRGKMAIEEACQQWPNVTAIPAYLPDMYGTHHSKMIILFRHDDLAQVIIHTANMLECDWTNATQAAWLSPLLPLQQGTGSNDSDLGPIGYGPRFKHDLMAYLDVYGKNRTGSLVKELQRYNFDAVRGAMIASVPSKVKNAFRDCDKVAVWGRAALWRALRAMPTTKISTVGSRKGHVVCQVSSIASFTEDWLEHSLFDVLGSNSAKRFSIIYPTAPDVAQSVSGYAYGSSIHMKGENNEKQTELLRPHLCRWTQSQKPNAHHAGRDLAAPHIKTYIRFSSTPTENNSTPDIDWALLTSANLSTQAWGSNGKKGKGKTALEEGQIHVQSYELGVLVWPELFADTEDRNVNMPKSGRQARMVPVFGTDKLDPASLSQQPREFDVVACLRMPYDLPLIPYTADEMPWSPNVEHLEPDRFGRIYAQKR